LKLIEFNCYTKYIRLGNRGAETVKLFNVLYCPKFSILGNFFLSMKEKVFHFGELF